jgi:hypothetical protein
LFDAKPGELLGETIRASDPINVDRVSQGKPNLLGRWAGDLL